MEIYSIAHALIQELKQQLFVYDMLKPTAESLASDSDPLKAITSTVLVKTGNFEWNI